MGRFRRRQRRFGEEADIPARKEKKKLSGPIAFAVLVIGIMSLSAIAFIQGGNSSTVRLDYKGYRFKTDENNRWIGKIEGREYLFYNHPLNVEGILLGKEAAEALRSARVVTVTSDMNSSAAEAIGLAEYEIKTMMAERNVFVDYAFTTNNSYGKQVIACSSNTSSFTPVIYFTLGNETFLRYDKGNGKNCIVAQASSPTEFMRLRDRILYAALGVISEG